MLVNDIAKPNSLLQLVLAGTILEGDLGRLVCDEIYSWDMLVLTLI
jgi:hypothetical protein